MGEAISFLEFAAACSWGNEDTKNTIAARAFQALDDNHDGLVNLEDCRHLFRAGDLPGLRNLPRNRSFALNEWLAALGCTYEEPKPKPEMSTLAQFIRSLMCTEDNPGHIDDRCACA